jgi:hypothetical protein
MSLGCLGPCLFFLQVRQLINSDFFPLVISGMLLERQESLGDVNPISKGSSAGEFKFSFLCLTSSWSKRVGRTSFDKGHFRL